MSPYNVWRQQQQQQQQVPSPPERNARSPKVPDENLGPLVEVHEARLEYDVVPKPREGCEDEAHQLHG